MSYRFVRITNYYPGFLKSFYSRNPGIESASYDEHYLRMIEDSFEAATCYTKNLNSIGVKASDIISNAVALQNSWAKENKLSDGTPVNEIILEQLKHFKPDVIWIDDFSFFDEDWKSKLIKNVPSIKLMYGHICAPYNSEMLEKFRMLDGMFTCTPCFKKELESIGIKCHLLYHSFEKTILNSINRDNQFADSDFVFTGSLYTGSGFHRTRIEYIEKMLKAGINMDLYCNLESWGKIMAKKGAYNVIRMLKKTRQDKLIDKIPVLNKNKSYGDTRIKYYSKKLIDSSKSPVFGYDMYKLLSKAKICFNIHGEVAQLCAGNIRMFEATGVGSCLVTDWKENIADLFETGKEIVTYNSVEECIDKVKWLISHPHEREKIAIAGQQKTLAEHTVENRSRQLKNIITEALK